MAAAAMTVAIAASKRSGCGFRLSAGSRWSEHEVSHLVRESAEQHD